MQFLFPHEIIQFILGNLSTRDLFRLKLVNCQFRQIIKQIEIGQLSQVQLSFPDDQSQFTYICKSANYLLFNHYFNIFKDNKSYEFWLQIMSGSCLSGDYHIPNHLIKKYRKFRKPSWNSPFVNACEGGNIKLVKKLMRLYHRDIAINWGLRRACLCGRIEIVKIIIEKLQQSKSEPGLSNSANSVDWNSGLFCACHGGHIEIAKFMIEKMPQLFTPNWFRGLFGACHSGNIEMVKFMIEKIQQSSITIIPEWDRGLYEACLGGNIEIVKLIIKQSIPNWNYGLEGACRGGHIEIVKFIIENLYRSSIDIHWNRGLYEACQYRHTEIVKFIIASCRDHGALYCNHCRKPISEH